MDPTRDLLPGDEITFRNTRKYGDGKQKRQRVWHTRGTFIKYTGKLRHAKIHVPYNDVEQKYRDIKQIIRLYRINHIQPKIIWCVIRNGIFL